MGFLELSIAFSAGVVAAFNPCGVVLLPTYIAYLIGTENENRGKSGNFILKGLKSGISMSFGFITIFLALGIIVSLVGRTIMQFAPWLGVMIGIIFLSYGLLVFIKPEKFSLQININKQLWSDDNSNVFIVLYLYGISYGVASLACTLPVFLAVVLTTLTAGTLTKGIMNFFLFSLGMGFTVTLISIGTLGAKALVSRWLGKIMPYMNRIIALFLIFAGGYLIYYWFWGGGHYIL